jgi:hypothetical protein
VPGNPGTVHKGVADEIVHAHSDARSQTSLVGETSAGNGASTSPITARDIPVFCEARMNATRRNVLRW